MPKNGYFKAEGLNIGWLGKIRNNRNFRIIGQGIKNMLYNFRVFIVPIRDWNIKKEVKLVCGEFI